MDTKLSNIDPYSKIDRISEKYKTHWVNFYIPMY